MCATYGTLSYSRVSVFKHALINTQIKCGKKSDVLLMYNGQRRVDQAELMYKGDLNGGRRYKP